MQAEGVLRIWRGVGVSLAGWRLVVRADEDGSYGWDRWSTGVAGPNARVQPRRATVTRTRTIIVVSTRRQLSTGSVGFFWWPANETIRDFLSELRANGYDAFRDLNTTYSHNRDQ